MFNLTNGLDYVTVSVSGTNAVFVSSGPMAVPRNLDLVDSAGAFIWPTNGQVYPWTAYARLSRFEGGFVGVLCGDRVIGALHYDGSALQARSGLAWEPGYPLMEGEVIVRQASEIRDIELASKLTWTATWFILGALFICGFYLTRVAKR